MARRCGYALVGALAVLSLVAGTAPAATFTLTLSAPSSATVSSPFVIQASGTDPTDQGALYLEIDAIPASVTTTCPSGYLDGSQLATSTGGDLVASDQRETIDASGNFSMPVGYTPKATGQMLFCGYTDDGATDTLATASTMVNVVAAGGGATGGGGTGPTTSGGATKPVNTRRPRVTRSAGRLVCDRGGWSGRPTRFAYRWLVKGKRLRRASGSTLAISRRLRGRRVQCGVTASNAAGSSIAVSRPVSVG